MANAKEQRRLELKAKGIENLETAELKEYLKLITIEDIVEYIDTNGTKEQKKGFKDAYIQLKPKQKVEKYINEKGEEKRRFVDTDKMIQKYCSLAGKQYFIDTFFSDIFAEKKKTPKDYAKERIAKW